VLLPLLLATATSEKKMRARAPTIKFIELHLHHATHEEERRPAGDEAR
jgi:hypothetical protein